MMVALAGCTAMDVVSLMQKMRVEIKDFNVTVEGTLTEEHPKHFTAMHIIYEFTGENLPLDKIERAIELSQDKYCGVSAVYKKVMDLTHEIRLL
jgi:putative redox protein